ncbi:hypothetical protein GCM10009540_02480 [Streptomyces turgidiscabies]|nr:hypothetical protein T45_00990 [Streptomyces turgidiscabies]
MLGTMIRDTYTKEGARDIRDALDDIASPRDNYGFSSVGVYCYFDPESSDVLYVGLARDLTQRFCHHNGLISAKPTTCKVREINAWFAEHERMGFAVFVQSPFEQVATARNGRRKKAQAAIRMALGELDEDDLSGLQHATTMEGILIESYRAKYGSIPPWNKMNASIAGQGLATQSGYNLLDIMTGKVDSLIMARRTIRELSGDPTSLEFENLLHGGRTYATVKSCGIGMDSHTVLAALNEMVSMPIREDQAKISRKFGCVLDCFVSLLPIFCSDQKVIRVPRYVQSLTH